MATLKIYEGKESILTYLGDCTINIVAHSTGMNVVVNSQEWLLLTKLELPDITKLALQAMTLIQQHKELRDRLLP